VFTSDGKKIVTGDLKVSDLNNGPNTVTTRLTIWDAADGSRLGQTTVAGMLLRSLAVLPDNGKMLVGGNEGEIYLYDLDGGKLLLSLAGRGQRQRITFSLSADGKTVISSLDRSAKLWDLLLGKEILSLEGHRRAVAAVAFSPDGRLVVTAGGSPYHPYEVTEPRRIRFWDLFDGKEVAHFEGHTADVSSLAFSPDGACLVSGHRDSTVLVWDMKSLPPLPEHKANGVDLASLWDALASAEPLKAHQAVWKLAAAPDKSLAFLKDRTSPVAVADPARLRRLIADFDSDDFKVRTAAFKEIEKSIDQAQSLLREVLKGNSSAEVRENVQKLREPRYAPQPESLRCLRTIQVLERMGSPGARQLLEKLAAGAPTARETLDAKAALLRLSRSF
jgi:WD40 repeat protein